MVLWERRVLGSARLDTAARLDLALPDVDWSIRPVDATMSVFAAPSGSLATMSLGHPTHPRVVLVPGATGSKEDFTLMMPLLVEAGYYVQSYDLAGQYESASAGPDPDSGEHYDYDLFVADLIAFLDTGEPAHVLGYSFAGIVAQLALVRRPDLFLSLALLSTPPLTRRAYRGVRWIGWLTPFVPATASARLMIWGIVTNKNKVPATRLVFLKERFRYTRRSSVVDIVGLMMKIPDVRAAVKQTNTPALVAVGRHDLWPLRLHRRFARALGARVEVYRTGHSPCETAPHQLCRDLLRLYAH